MAYERWSTSDVYVFLHGFGFLTCQRCTLMPKYTVPARTIKLSADSKGVDMPEMEWHEDFACKSTDAMVDHLRKHQEAGENTGEAIERLIEDKEENDAWMLEPHTEF